MPTLKHRVNLTVPARMDKALQQLAMRDELSVAAKTLQLLQDALELEEDAVLLSVAEAREKKKSCFFSHNKTWKALTS